MINTCSSPTLHIDREGAGEEEGLEGWHGPRALHIAQLLGDGLLPVQGWVGHRGLDLAPAAAGQARAGRRQRGRAHGAVVRHGVRVLAVVDEVRLYRQVHGHRAVNGSVVEG